jgi:putative proteasome-type protease
VTRRRRLEQGDPYFTALRGAWSDGVRDVFTRLPEPTW